MFSTPFRAQVASLGLILLVLAACSEDPPPSGGSSQSLGQSGFSQERPPSSGGLEVVPYEGMHPERPGYFDFGEVQLGQVVTHTFVLRNADPRMVTLQKVDPGCGCTVARIGKRLPDGSLEPALSDSPGELMRIEPDGIIEVMLRVDTSAIRVKNTDKLFMVRLASDSVQRPFLTLECRLFVREIFRVAPESLDLGVVPIGAGKEGQVTIKAMGPELHELIELGPLPEGVTARLEVSPMAGPNGGLWTLTAGYSPPLKKGRIGSQVVIYTRTPEGEPGADLEVHLAGTGVNDVTITPARIILRPSMESSSGKAKEVTPARTTAELVSHLAGHRFKVIGYEITGEAADALTLEVSPSRPANDGSSAEWNLALVVKSPPSKATFVGTVLIDLDDSQYPRMELSYAGIGF